MNTEPASTGIGRGEPGAIELKDVALVIALGAWLLAPRWPSLLRWIALGAILVGLLAPRLLIPLARAWFGLASVLGRIMPPVVMGAIFYAMVVPLGVLRRWTSGERVLRTREFGRGTNSVFVDRPHLYGPSDFERQF